MIFIIGYGNPLRSDDAIGQRIAQIIKVRMLDAALQVTTAYQLTPELVEPIRQAQVVIFIDARQGETPGMVIAERVEPAIEAGAFTHNVSPGTLLGAAHELFGADPTGILISIAGAAFDIGSDLSAELHQMLPRIVDEVESIINTNIKILI